MDNQINEFAGKSNDQLGIILIALAGEAQWVGCHPANQKVAGSIQGTCRGCRPGPWWEACKSQPIHVSLEHGCFSPSLSPSLLLSLKMDK